MCFQTVNTQHEIHNPGCVRNAHNHTTCKHTHTVVGNCGSLFQIRNVALKHLDRVRIWWIFELGLPFPQPIVILYMCTVSEFLCECTHQWIKVGQEGHEWGVVR